MMPYAIEITQSYEKRLVKFLKKHRDITSKYGKVIRLLEVDPFHPSLRLHKLFGKLDKLYSVSIDMQYRISIEFYIEDNKIIPVQIGTHDEVYK
ncbi:MAG: plasmid stabilization protein [Sulfurovum sp.]|nr:plasmid stabilization protein [Sulfurovum sp.]